MHRYCTQPHTTDRIPNTNVKSGSCTGTKAVRLRGVTVCDRIEVDASIIYAFKV